jgi:hypothetical protein
MKNCLRQHLVSDVMEAFIGQGMHVPFSYAFFPAQSLYIYIYISGKGR